MPKPNQGKLNLSSQGAGTAPHLAFELFRMMTGVNIVHVRIASTICPICWRVRCSFRLRHRAAVLGCPLTARLGALGVTSVKSMEALPDVRPISASLPGYEGSGWAGVGAPHARRPMSFRRSTRPSDPRWPIRRSARAALGAVPEPMTPSQFGTLVRTPPKWAKVMASPISKWIEGLAHTFLWHERQQ